MRLRALAPVLLLAACTTSGHGTGTTSSAPPVSSTPPPTSGAPSSSSQPPPASSSQPPPPASAAERVFAAMSERQRVGQLLMVDCSTTGVGPATITAITQYHVGSVILDGTSYAGLQETRAVTSQLQGLAPRKVGLFISTDQEGGLVQRLQGAGFTRIPSAVQQGQFPTSALRDDARHWGAELHRAGVNVNLAPVLDTVPPGFGSNPPIGDLDREYGTDPTHVMMSGIAFAEGFADAGVDATVKHFPGLGRVTGNTDTSSGVTDSVTTRHDRYLLPFAGAVSEAHVAFVMMSTAIYARIDPGVPAAFSRTIVTGMLRGDLGFRGLIISDDLGGAAQVSGYSIGERAVRFVAAGGDVVLTVNANQAAEMTSALLARAEHNPSFKSKVDAAALLVLQEKQARGLLTG